MYEYLYRCIGADSQSCGIWLQGKADKNAAAAELKLTEAKAKAQILLSKETSVADWERIMAEGAKSSWKDEWFVNCPVDTIDFMLDSGCRRAG